MRLTISSEYAPPHSSSTDPLNISKSRFFFNESFHTGILFTTLLNLNIRVRANSKLRLKLCDESCITIWQFFSKFRISFISCHCHCWSISIASYPPTDKTDVNVIILDNAIIDRFWRHDDPSEVSSLIDMTFIASRGFDMTSQPFRIHPPVPDFSSPYLTRIFAGGNHSSENREDFPFMKLIILKTRKFDENPEFYNCEKWLHL